MSTVGNEIHLKPSGRIKPTRLDQAASRKEIRNPLPEPQSIHVSKVRIQAQQRQTVFQCARRDPEVVRGKGLPLAAQARINQCIAVGGIHGQRDDVNARSVEETRELRPILRLAPASGKAAEQFAKNDGVETKPIGIRDDFRVGTEIKKTRPALIVSPDDMNAALPRVIVAPITRKGQPLGCRPELTFQGRPARVLLDQIRCIDKARLAGKLGDIEPALWHGVLLQMLE